MSFNPTLAVTETHQIVYCMAENREEHGGKGRGEKEKEGGEVEEHRRGLTH